MHGRTPGQRTGRRHAQRRPNATTQARSFGLGVNRRAEHVLVTRALVSASGACQKFPSGWRRHTACRSDALSQMLPLHERPERAESPKFLRILRSCNNPNLALVSGCPGIWQVSSSLLLIGNRDPAILLAWSCSVNRTDSFWVRVIRRGGGLGELPETWQNTIPARGFGVPRSWLCSW